MRKHPDRTVKASLYWFREQEKRIEAFHDKRRRDLSVEQSDATYFGRPSRTRRSF